MEMETQRARGCRISLTNTAPVSGEIRPHFHVKNIFLAQKLTKWHHFKEIYEQKYKEIFEKPFLTYSNLTHETL